MSGRNAIARLTDVTVRYSRLTAVHNVSLEIANGATIGLVGESGCGKSSLAKALVRLAPIATGSIEIDGTDITHTAARKRRWLPSRVQLLHQDAAASLSPRLKVRRLLEEPLRIAGRWNAASWRELVGTLGEMGLSEQILDRYPHQLSGGQAKRVALLRALAMRPRILVADEPTAGLDLSIQGEILNLLARMKDHFSLTYLIVSHNLNVIGRITDQVAVMYLGEIVESGPTRSVFRSSVHPYTRALLSANTIAGRSQERIVLRGELPSPLDPPTGCRFQTRCPHAQAICRSVAPKMVSYGDGHSAACHFPLVTVPAPPNRLRPVLA